MPGDVVLATPTGVIFVPPQYAREVVESSENTRLRDYWARRALPTAATRLGKWIASGRLRWKENSLGGKKRLT